MEKGNSAGLTLKESLPIGITYYSSDEINDIVDYFGEFWHGKDYDPFAKNCNDFTHALIGHICDKAEYYFPSYVNRFTKLGAILKMWFKPLQDLIGNIVDYDNVVEESSSSDSREYSMVPMMYRDDIILNDQDVIAPPVCRPSPILARTPLENPMNVNNSQTQQQYLQ